MYFILYQKSQKKKNKKTTRKVCCCCWLVLRLHFLGLLVYSFTIYSHSVMNDFITFPFTLKDGERVRGGLERVYWLNTFSDKFLIQRIFPSSIPFISSLHLLFSLMPKKFQSRASSQTHPLLWLSLWLFDNPSLFRKQQQQGLNNQRQTSSQLISRV